MGATVLQGAVMNYSKASPFLFLCIKEVLWLEVTLKTKVVLTSLFLRTLLLSTLETFVLYFNVVNFEIT